MQNLDILEKGNIYFFYRPKLQHEEAHGLEEVQRFFSVFKPASSPKYLLLVIGKKSMPEGKGQPFFAFIDYITEDLNDLMSALNKQHYDTSTRGKRDLPPVRCIGEGKYFIANHDNHTHLYYQLKTPSATGEVQEEFNLENKGDYIISVKNPSQPAPPKVGLTPRQKANYPDDLKTKFKDYRFIPLNPVSYLSYEGAELLLISKGTADLSEKDPHIEDCLSQVQDEELIERFKDIQEPKFLTPLFEKKWA